MNNAASEKNAITMGAESRTAPQKRNEWIIDSKKNGTPSILFPLKKEDFILNSFKILAFQHKLSKLHRLHHCLEQMHLALGAPVFPLSKTAATATRKKVDFCLELRLTTEFLVAKMLP